MAQRDQFIRTFGCLNSGNLCHSQDISFGQSMLAEFPNCLRRTYKVAFGYCTPVLHDLTADIDHMRTALRINVAKSRLCRFELSFTHIKAAYCNQSSTV